MMEKKTKEGKTSFPFLFSRERNPAGLRPTEKKGGGLNISISGKNGGCVIELDNRTVK